MMGILIDENSLKALKNERQMEGLRRELERRYNAKLEPLPMHLHGRLDTEVARYARLNGFKGILTQDEDFINNLELKNKFEYIFLVQRVPASVSRQEWRVIVYRNTGWGLRKEAIFGVTPTGFVREYV